MMIDVGWIASFTEPDFILPVLVFSIPVIAIAGGIVHGIVRSLGQQRMLEMAQRERIAAIERGFDPSKLPPFPMGSEREDWGLDSQLRRFQGLLIGGIVLVFVGVGLLAFLHLIQPDEMIWAVALMPIFAGVALLLSALIVRPRNGRNSSGS